MLFAWIKPVEEKYRSYLKLVEKKTYQVLSYEIIYMGEKRTPCVALIILNEKGELVQYPAFNAVCAETEELLAKLVSEVGGDLPF